MTIGVTAAVVIAVAVGVGIGMSAEASKEAARETAAAQKYTAEQNAKATIEAAKLAADAQKSSAEYDMKARMHESDVAFNQEMEYLKQEKWMAEREDDNQSYWQNTQAQIDSIDTYYGGEGAWGLGSGEANWDYGYDTGGAGDYGGGPYSGEYS